nr:5089_t:CDS:2 [Entrophospora candida]
MNPEAIANTLLVDLHSCIEHNLSQISNIIEHSKIIYEQFPFDYNLSFVFQNIPPAVIVDSLSTGLLPQQYKQNYICADSTSDGNCLFHTASIALYGSEKMSKWFRLASIKYSIEEDTIEEEPIGYDTNSEDWLKEVIDGWQKYLDLTVLSDDDSTIKSDDDDDIVDITKNNSIQDNNHLIGLLIGTDEEKAIPNTKALDDFIEYEKCKDFSFQLEYQEQKQFPPQIAVAVQKTYNNGQPRDIRKEALKDIRPDIRFTGNRQNVPSASASRTIKSESNPLKDHNLLEKMQVTIMEVNQTEKDDYVKKNGMDSLNKRKLLGYIQDPVQTEPLSIVFYNKAYLEYYHLYASRNPGIFIDYTGQLIKPVPPYLCAKYQDNQNDY